jgi:subtilisin family serine protease
VPNDPYYSSSNSWGQGYYDMWGLKIIDMEHAWDFSKGAGVLVAVVDSGIDYNHPDLKANMWKNSDEIPGNGIDDDHNGYVDDRYGIERAWNHSSDPMDDRGHGTHVAGTIAALTNNGIGVASVAPQAKVMAVKGLSDTGRGYDANLGECIEYAVDNGADVLNFSWGGPYDFPTVTEACQYAHGLGCVLVAAAGNNNGDAYGMCPANLPEVITVASSTHTDKKSDYSNWGPKIDVAAPGGDNYRGDKVPYKGRNILSLRAANTDMYGDGHSMGMIGNDPPTYYYYRARGTSMAAPHVSGLAALVASIRPDLTNEEIRQAIRSGSDDLGIEGRDNFFGDGRINAYHTLCNLSGTLALYSIKPNSGFVDKTVTIFDLGGANFKTGATVWLESPAGVPLQKLPATNVVVVPPKKITCTIDLTGAKYSKYDVVVHIPDGREARLQSGFTVCGTGAGVALLALAGILGLMSTASSRRFRSRLKALLKCY